MIGKIKSYFSKVRTLQSSTGIMQSATQSAAIPFTIERELINGKHVNECTHPSIIHFSFNKAATQYVKSILIRCAVENGMTPVGINDYAFNTNFPFLDHLTSDEMRKYRHVFRKQGYLYSLFGGMVEGIPDLGEYKIVFGVRDPRDMLVSGYYSQAFSHVVPDEAGDKHEGFMQRRLAARESTIDDYVINESKKVLAVFTRYNDQLLESGIGLFVARYEDMMSNFRDWLSKLIDYCEFDISNDLFESIVKEHYRQQPKDEDIYKHLRKGMPGDYKEKLQPESIEYLNEMFSVMLKRFDYPL